MAMDYEARHSRGFYYALAGGCVALSILGFAAAGIIPTKSGSNPAIGWTIVAACFAAALIFVRRAGDRTVQARLDGDGIYARRYSAEPVPWSSITGASTIRLGVQRVARFDVRDSAAARKTTFGINTTFYDRGMPELVAAVRHHRPDLLR
jgi:hypothetical protein